MANTTLKKRVIKLQDTETVRLLELYAVEPVLYDPNIEEYKDRDLRMAALKRISDELNIPGFGPNEVASKFRNFKSSYCQELKKIADKERSKTSTDVVYRPKLFWFELMNSFIRPFIQQRSTQSNMVLSTNRSEESQLEQSQSQDVDDLNETVLWTPHITTDVETPRTTVKRKLPSNISQPSSSKIQKASHDSQIDYVSGEKLENILIHAVQTRKEDTYDCFGKYVASMLRSIGSPLALKLQKTITSIIINAMCPLPTPSNQAPQQTGGTKFHFSRFR